MIFIDSDVLILNGHMIWALKCLILPPPPCLVTGIVQQPPPSSTAKFQSRDMSESSMSPSLAEVSNTSRDDLFNVSKQGDSAIFGHFLAFFG